MTKKWIGINLLLVVVAVIAGYQLYSSIQQFEADNDISKVMPAESGDSDTILPPSPIYEPYSPMDFIDVSEKNVFSETRTREESTTDSTPATGIMPDSQKPTLVGVIVSENQKVATLLEPGSRGQSGQTVFKKLGETYQEYTITDIESDHIVLDNGSQRVTIDLNDISRPAPTQRTAVIPTRVIPIGGGAAVGTAPIIVASSSPRSGRSALNRTSSQQPNTPTDAGGRNFIVPVGTQGQPGSATETGQQQPTTPVPATEQPSATNNTGQPQGRTRVIRTPFGEIMRGENVR